MTGIEAFLEILNRVGVRHIFGNPGTTELPLNDALADDPRFTYIFGLHEIPVVAMADGFAMASGGPAVANVHVTCGLGNAMGMLYNAHIEGTPLILTAGQQDRRLRLEEPVIEGDTVSVARTWTKWAYEVGRVEDIPVALRRAIQTALTPPTGPVFLSIPVDIQGESAEGLDLSPPHVPDRRVRPPVEGLRRAAELLTGARIRRSWPEAGSRSRAGWEPWSRSPSGSGRRSSPRTRPPTAACRCRPTTPSIAASCPSGRPRSGRCSTSSTWSLPSG